MSKDHLTTIVPSELKIRHNDYFREGFQIKRVAKAFLKKKLPKRTLARLDLEGLTVENPHLTDEMYKEGIADVVYRVPIKGTKRKKHINFLGVAVILGKRLPRKLKTG